LGDSNNEFSFEHTTFEMPVGKPSGDVYVVVGYMGLALWRDIWV
jgi:hypothetical protein